MVPAAFTRLRVSGPLIYAVILPLLIAVAAVLVTAKLLVAVVVTMPLVRVSVLETEIG